MSTGLNCEFYETPAGKHYYSLEIGGDPDDEENYHTDEYRTYGPFPDFESAKKHLADNHANPGGYCQIKLDAEPSGEIARMISEAIDPGTVRANRFSW